MKIHSFSDIPEKLFWPLKQWLDADINHFNMMIGVGLLLILIAFVWLFVLTRLLGRTDERSRLIYLKAVAYGLIAYAICKIIFPDEYLNQQFDVYAVIIGLLIGDGFIQLTYLRE